MLRDKGGKRSGTGADGWLAGAGSTLAGS